MINFNEQRFLEIGASIYNRRAEIEQIADKLTEKEFSNLFFSSVGGSQAMMDPFYDMVQEYSKIPVYSVLSSTLVLTGHNQLDKDSVVFMASKSGDTKETVAACKYVKEIGCTVVSVCGKEDSVLESLSDYCFVYGDGRPQELVYYLLIGKVLFNKGYFPEYPKFADELKNLPQVLCDCRKAVDEYALEYCKKYCDAPYHIWIGSGNCWPVVYAFAMCVLEESLWIRTKSVSSPEFFHGTLELLEKDVPVTLCMTEGKTRPLDERVKNFIGGYSDEVSVFDTRDYPFTGISDEFRGLLSPVVMNALLQRISKNMEVIKNHDLNTRRYYRKVTY